MANILIVSDQERLIAIFTTPGFLPGAEVRVARTIEQALAAQANGRYRFILIQERLGEISGHIVAHRMAAESTGKKPHIIMLCNGDRNDEDSGKQVQAIQCAGLSDEEIVTAARELLAGKERKPGRQRKKANNQIKKEPEADLISTPPPAADMVDDVVQIGKTAAQPAARTLSGKTVADSANSDLAKSSFQEKLDIVLGETGNDIHTTPAKPSPVDRGIRPAPLMVKWGKAPLAERIRMRIAGRKPLAMILAAAAVTIILTLFAVKLLHKTPDVSKAEKKTASPGVAKSPAAANPPNRELRSLPSFIPPRSADPGYGKSHPGWERYLTAATEFRVYREMGTIRALQVIDRSGQGVQAGLFTSVLNETASSRQYIVEGRESKGSFLIEKGRLANGAKIIVYRHVPGNRVKALVIDLN